jgi:hypothetical protein
MVCTPVIPALGRLRQEDQELEASLRFSIFKKTKEQASLSCLLEEFFRNSSQTTSVYMQTMFIHVCNVEYELRYSPVSLCGFYNAGSYAVTTFTLEYAHHPKKKPMPMGHHFPFPQLLLLTVPNQQLTFFHSLQICLFRTFPINRIIYVNFCDCLL